MDKQFIGCTVSVDCGKEGTFQGEVSNINGSTLVLQKAFKNGIAYDQPLAVIRSELIQDLIILKNAEESTQRLEPTASTITVRKPIAKRISRTVSENITGNKLLHNSESNSSNNIVHNSNFVRWNSNSGIINGSSSSSNNSVANGSNNSTTNNHSSTQHQLVHLPRPCAPNWLAESSWSNDNPRLTNFNQPGNEMNRGPTKRERQKQKDELCFGGSINEIKKNEFDFEKNLALFNKKAIYDEINAQRPDLVRQTDRNLNYKHNESVLSSPTVKYRQISVPNHDTQKEYVTDDGQIIPTIPNELRRLLLNLAEDYGFTFERQSETLGRAATEIGIQLLGGARRLTPQNSHQKPVVVVMCESNRPGAMGLNTARQLVSHGITVIVYLVNLNHVTTQVSQELSLYKLTGQKYTTNIHDLPSGADLVVIALADERTSQLNGSAATWLLNCRAPIMAVDPPATGTPGVAAKLSIISTLPLVHCQANGQLYLVNFSIPKKVYNELNINYKSPFGSKFVIPIHFSN